MRHRVHANAIVRMAIVVTVIVGASLAPNVPSVAATPQQKPNTLPCGGPMRSGAIDEPPQIEMASLPLDDLGRHELILHVVRKGNRFCYRYTLAGVVENRAPVLRVHRGETFAIRLVNELRGPAPGATMATSALASCAPGPMPPMSPQTFNGYMNHAAIAKPMSVVVASNMTPPGILMYIDRK